MTKSYEQLQLEWTGMKDEILLQRKEIEQLRQERHQLQNELTAARLEGERLRNALVVTQRYVHEREFPVDHHVRSTVDEALGTAPLIERGADEPNPARDADHCDYPDCEQHWTYIVDQVKRLAAGNVTGCGTCSSILELIRLAQKSKNQDGQQAPAPSGNAGLGTAGGASSLHQSLQKSEALQPIFTVCGICQRKATVTSQSEVKLLGIICERADCPGRPS